MQVTLTDAEAAQLIETLTKARDIVDKSNLLAIAEEDDPAEREGSQVLINLSAAIDLLTRRKQPAPENSQN
jgi:hypothetical protein